MSFGLAQSNLKDPANQTLLLRMALCRLRKSPWNFETSLLC